ncbi:dTDP-4-dehydrorhamnose 3,5-epimerase [Crossiella sp. SN42]|uniref:dTDP-4-dehydrorhamnose 3,5-epimerase family protein n=1 Tax=Crossiella sp. SN42 TaxID=2944808 RepID=UPI00207D217C|nr:dTDP-4-dehydrorhamnose 3,5-epimerase [Crossiella sp. SN42]MCO1574620.1 dTDP-4-dehydrorhamnose 3,5-epimerase [Crossiella sp. SN42]
MRTHRLAVTGAHLFVPETHLDDRGSFVSPFQEPAFRAAVGTALFPVAQTNISESRRGVLRGIHFTRTPPGTAKYVSCVRGRALDVVVDLRIGSPTFGRWDAVELDGTTAGAVYLPLGVGHAFLALAEGTVMSYLMSGGYVAEHELAVSATDPELGLPLPHGIELVRSARDRAAPTLARARAAGLLPRYTDCVDPAQDTRTVGT